ncbi:MAG TPA: MlaD family protein [bacterium]|nr:MlaD family protein [bacterium]
MASKSIQYKVGLFIVTTIVLIILAGLFIAYKKDLFADLAMYRLQSESGEGLTQGMPVLFSGFEIGKVKDLELSDKGQVVITITVPRKHVRWIREESTFTLEKPLVGTPRIVVRTENPEGKELSYNKIVPIKTIDDINEVIKKAQPLVERIQSVADNIDRMTNADSELNKIIADTRKMTKMLSEKKSLLEMATGDKKGQETLMKTLEQVAAITETVDGTMKRIDGMVAKADEAVLGDKGSIAIVNNILTDIEGKFKRLDTLIDNAITMSADLQGTTQDINLVRKEVEETISSVNKLIQDVRNSLPFEQKKEIKLP